MSLKAELTFTSSQNTATFDLTSKLSTYNF